MSDYVNWFVNREKQYHGFLKMLAHETPKAIMLIEAPADMGKTWLIQTMRHHCDQNGVPAMHIDFRDRRPYDYLSLVRRARDQMGASYFNPLTETINNFTSVNINLAAGSSSGGVKFGDIDVRDLTDSSLHIQEIAGGNIVKDNQFHIQADSDTARRAAEIRINDAFFACLATLREKGPVVFLFDSYEEVTPEAEYWLCDHLLLQMNEEQLSNTLVIIAGRKTPDLGAALKPLVAKTGLDLFLEEHVREYIVDRRQIKGLDVETIVKTCGGFPGLLAKMADLASMDAQDDDDWL